MNKALIYRPNNRKLIWMAFVCAITIHLGAIAIAENKAKPVSASWEEGSDGPPVIGTIDPSPQSPEAEIILSPEQPVNDQQEFVDENVTRPPIPPQKRTPVAAVPPATGFGTARSMGFGSAKALTLYAPKPNYPYEARRGGITGTGVAQLRVNTAAGNVIDAHMSQSTGNSILDNATVSAFRRWRFKPGVAANVDVPITYTLAGVSY